MTEQKQHKEQIVKKDGIRNLRDPVWNVILHCMSFVRDDHPGWTKSLPEEDHVRVVFAMNGVDLPFEEYFHHVSDHLVAYVGEKALEIYEDNIRDYEIAYEDQLQELQESVDRLRKQLENQVRAKLKLNIKDRDITRYWKPDIHTVEQMPLAMDIARLEDIDHVLSDERLDKYLGSEREEIRQKLETARLKIQAEFDMTKAKRTLETGNTQ